MTEEQIKHNAEQYATRYDIRGTRDGEVRYMDKKDAYIAGARSCYKEIEGLKKKLEDMTILKNFFASSLDIYDKDNKQLQDELNIHRNQWISVKERLPKKRMERFVQMQFQLLLDNIGLWQNIILAINDG